VARDIPFEAVQAAVGSALRYAATLISIVGVDAAAEGDAFRVET